MTRTGALLASITAAATAAAVIVSAQTYGGSGVDRSDALKDADQ
jgi:hypothetical protein